MFYDAYVPLFLGTCILVAICITGDKICSLPAMQKAKFDSIRAFADNLTHGLVGGLSWWILRGYMKHGLNIADSSRLKQSLYCMFLSSVIDVDHFIAAGSLTIKDVLNLPRRPPLHCSGFTLLFSIGVWLVIKYYPGMQLLPWEWFVAFSSHHIRDATRRGIWILPGISTKPVPYVMYLIITTLIPPLTAIWVPRETNIYRVETL